jgi:ankyrin repeat protein
MSKPVWLTLCLAVLLFGCGQSKEQAIQELEKLNVRFTPDDFVRSAENGDTKAVQLFIEAGIDCNVQSGAGLTALMAASRNGRIDVVMKLLDQKVKINAQGKDGVTALMLAADRNQLDIVNLLLKKNADPNVEDQRGWTALIDAAYQGNSKCVEALAARSREEVNRGLLVAALMGRKETAKVLLDHGAEVDSRAEDGRTPLMLAANKGDQDLVSLLLQAGADPTLVDKSGATAGSLAAAKGYKELAGRLRQAPPPSVAGGPPQKSLLSGNSAEPTGAMSDKDVLSQSESSQSGRKGAGTADAQVRSGGSKPTEASENSPEIKQVAVVDIHQEFLPVMLTEVRGKKAKIQAVGGEEYSVAAGDQLRGLDYQVTDVEIRNTEDKDGNPVDDSIVKLRNTKTGQTVTLIRGVPAQEHAAYAVLSFPNSEQTLKVEVDQNFSIPSDPGHTYKVLDIRPRQIIIRRIEDNRVSTLQKQTRS